MAWMNRGSAGRDRLYGLLVGSASKEMGKRGKLGGLRVAEQRGADGGGDLGK